MSEQTIEKLKKMKLSKFAEAYQDQKGKPEYQKMSFDDRLTLLVDLEYDSRVNHTIERVSEMQPQCQYLLKKPYYEYRYGIFAE